MDNRPIVVRKGRIPVSLRETPDSESGISLYERCLRVFSVVYSSTKSLFPRRGRVKEVYRVETKRDRDIRSMLVKRPILNLYIFGMTCLLWTTTRVFEESTNNFFYLVLYWTPTERDHQIMGHVNRIVKGVRERIGRSIVLSSKCFNIKKWVSYEH